MSGFYGCFSWERGEDGRIYLDVRGYDRMEDAESFMSCCIYKNKAVVTDRENYDRMLKLTTGQEVKAI